MRKLCSWFLFVWLLLPFGMRAEGPLAGIKVSDVLREGTISLYKPEFGADKNKSLFDTLRLHFQLTNDLGRDTTVYFYEGLNEWVKFDARPMNDSTTGFVTISGRNFYNQIPYEYVEFPCRPIHLQAGGAYNCLITYEGTTYRKTVAEIYLVSQKDYTRHLANERTYEYTNHIITYFFVGSLAFGFFFFFFLYLKSRYPVFGFYALFLFIQVLYGVIQFDVYTGIGSFMRTRPHWDDYVNEVLVFLGQAVYVLFMGLWMEVKSSGGMVYRFFRAIGLFFLVYALSFLALYEINSHSHVLYQMERWIRITAILIQLVVFYLVIFKIKSPVKGYVLAGTCLVILFGVGFVAMARAGLFENTAVQFFDYGSWYMIGVLCECMCFASGLGLRYFLIDQSNARLQEENIQALEGKLLAEKEAREKESKVAELNQEVTNQQLTALRAQMNPHFIFNALNSIQKYIVTGSVDEANSYLSKFSRLQRMILAYSEENFITLDKEIEILRLYLELEQLRLTQEFHFDILLDPEIEPEEIHLPPMILQPFAENAIWHGLIPKQGDKELRIEFRLDGDDVLRCIVEDNGIGRKAAQKMKAEKQGDKTVNKSKGMAMVHDRLKLLEKKYGTSFRVLIIDKEDQPPGIPGTRVEMDIPLVE